MGLGMGRFANPETSPGVCCSQKPECPEFIISAASDCTLLPHCGLCDGLILLMARRDRPTLRSVPTPQGHPEGTQRDLTQAEKHKLGSRSCGQPVQPSRFQQGPRRRKKGFVSGYRLLLCCRGGNLGETRGGRGELTWMAGKLGISAGENPADGGMEQGQRDRLPAEGQALHREREGDGDSLGETHSHNPLTLHCQRPPGKSQ